MHTRTNDESALPLIRSHGISNTGGQTLETFPISFSNEKKKKISIAILI